MSKKACKNPDYKRPKEPNFICKKCKLKAEKENQLCKAERL